MEEIATQKLLSDFGETSKRLCASLKEYQEKSEKLTAELQGAASEVMGKLQEEMKEMSPEEAQAKMMEGIIMTMASFGTLIGNLIAPQEKKEEDVCNDDICVAPQE